MVDNQTLVEQVLANEPYAFEHLIKKFQRLVSHVVFRMISNEADREDICQDVFLKVYKNLSGFRQDSKLSTWIARIAYNGCLNYLEKKKVPLFDDITSEEKNFEDSASTDPGPDQITERSNISGVLRDEIDLLPVKYRTILTLFHLDEMTYDEISSVMSIPKGTVKSYLFRARQLLKEKLQSRYQTEDLWG